MHQTFFIQDLAIVMIVAGLVTVLFHHFKQPVVLGYIIAGILIGPHMPPFALIKNDAIIETLAELGVVFLMFSLGLHFNLRKLKSVGATACVIAIFEVLFTFCIGYTIGQFAGWSKMDRIFLGAILSISSTTIIVKALTELKRVKEKFAELIFGILIIEDILAIAMIAFLSSVVTSGAPHPSAVILTLGKLGIFLITVLIIGLITVPPLLHYISKFKSNEMLLVTVLGLCFGVCLLAIKMEYNIALGAFLIGAIISEAKENTAIEILVEPVRDLFSAVFFVAIGMLIDPALILQYKLLIILIVFAFIIGKVLACSVGAFITGNNTRTSIQVGMGLAQIGEFSFIIATLGLTFKATSEFLYPIAVTVSAITTLLTPYLIRSSDHAAGWFDRMIPASITDQIERYHHWVQGLGHIPESDFARQLLRKLTFQTTLNLALATSVFMIAVFIAQKMEAWSLHIPYWASNTTSFIWLCSVLIALPILITIFRKLEVLGMLAAEIVIPTKLGNRHPTTSRAIIANTIFVISVIGVGIWIVLISSPLLPAWPTLITFILIIAFVTTHFWRLFVQIYAKAQYALHKIFLQPPESHSRSSENLLGGAELEKITLMPSFWASGKLIRDIQLRVKTGVNAIGIERANASILNPGGEEVLQAGDKVLLLGSRKQLRIARDYLMKG